MRSGRKEEVRAARQRLKEEGVGKFFFEPVKKDIKTRPLRVVLSFLYYVASVYVIMSLLQTVYYDSVY